jgi:hypothetical protein
LQTQVLDQMEFTPVITSTTTMPADCFATHS